MKQQTIKKTEEKTYFKLNNQLNIPVDGQIPIAKDKEAVRAYFLEHINMNTVFFHSLDEKLGYLIEHDYIDKNIFLKYPQTEESAGLADNQGKDFDFDFVVDLHFEFQLVFDLRFDFVFSPEFVHIAPEENPDAKSIDRCFFSVKFEGDFS